MLGQAADHIGLLVSIRGTDLIQRVTNQTMASCLSASRAHSCWNLVVCEGIAPVLSLPFYLVVFFQLLVFLLDIEAQYRFVRNFMDGRLEKRLVM